MTAISIRYRGNRRTYLYATDCALNRTTTDTISIEVAPMIDQLYVSDESNCQFTWSGSCVWGTAEFVVSWTVSDANANLDSAVILFVDSNGNIIDNDEIAVTGGSESGKITLTEDFGYDSEYTIEIDVADKTGLIRSDAVDDTTDGTDP